MKTFHSRLRTKVSKHCSFPDELAVNTARDCDNCTFIERTRYCRHLIGATRPLADLRRLLRRINRVQEHGGDVAGSGSIPVYRFTNAV